MFKVTPDKLSFHGETYRFVTNTRKDKLLHLNECAKLLNIHPLFVDNATTADFDSLPTHCSTYVLESDREKDPYYLDKLIHATSLLSKKYKEELLRQGYDVEDIPDTDIYLGYEKTITRGEKQHE